MAAVPTSGKEEDEHHEVKAARLASLYKDGAAKTIFDKIISKQIPATVVYEDEKCLAFRDVNPQAPTHILVIPKDRDGLTQLSKARDDQAAILGHLMLIAGRIGDKECPNGFRLVVNDGQDGCQSVFHLHIHIVGGRQMKWPPG
eukprot:CAMPEP_0195009446 /NCGR_PEP_ID=MMETSP0326_2-20130528/9310_1 /TAXON_ID=2866 ORGANISM="Crypthecodinium cohnii, Strain Seligo" /NCGR_SAMPLE_ID=MMETSP0326_2 /ASSEMBLY_ACC=CAM_ASM_000348 /LENGTH=143 /DNA_ID=CAMNT_0040017683 /DNA_START=99 /DNA_END=530 /DNA_ORIENTATION=+